MPNPPTQPDDTQPDELAADLEIAADEATDIAGGVPSAFLWVGSAKSNG